MLRVLYSFPLRFDKKGIGLTAWHQVMGLVNNGVQVDLFCASCDVDVDCRVRIIQTLVPMGLRIPLKLMGYSKFIIHDFIVSNYLQKYYQNYDVVHCWPSGGLKTLEVAKKIGVISFMERPSSHTKYVFDKVKKECRKLNIRLKKSHYASFDKKRLAREEREFSIADYLLCPSEFVAFTFREQGFDQDKLCLHHYGYDPDIFSPDTDLPVDDNRFRVLYVANCSPLKGLHYALEAWFQSDAYKSGIFMICGDIAEGYECVINKWLNHPSVQYMGFRNEVANLMRSSDVLILPSLTEGSALVTYEARACGCAILVSSASGAWGTDGYDLLSHAVGDVETLSQQINLLYKDRALLERIKQNGLNTIKNYTWDNAAKKIIILYSDKLGK